MSAKTTARAFTQSTSPSVIEFPPVPAAAQAFAFDAAQQRSLAIAAGDLQVAIRREVQRLLAEHQGNTMSALKVGLERLRSAEHIHGAEFDTLVGVCESVFAADRGKLDAKIAYEKTRSAYDQLLLDGSSSPVALTILSVLSSAYSLAFSTAGSHVGEHLIAAKISQGGDIGLAGGVVLGTIVGGIIGGFGGAILGGVIGGVVGTAVGLCAAK
jgi:hypothetical protein